MRPVRQTNRETDPMIEVITVLLIAAGISEIACWVWTQGTLLVALFLISA
jgi:hypothetical protein